MVETISQSMIKDVRNYMDGQECGHLVRVKWIDGKLLDNSTASMRLGCYFEYILTGALPKDGKIPQPEYMASVVKKNGGAVTGLKIEDMYEPYRRAHEAANRVKQYLQIMGLELVKAGFKIRKGRFEGTIDAIFKATKKIVMADGHVIKKGEQIAVDIKYSGLIEDKWSIHGWQWSPHQKRYHGTQAKQYHFLTGLPLYFLVVSSSKEFDVKFFRTHIDEHAVEAHISEGNNMREKLDFYNSIGFEPRPELKRCMDCPLFEGCKDRHEFPSAELVDLTIE